MIQRTGGTRSFACLVTVGFVGLGALASCSSQQAPTPASVTIAGAGAGSLVRVVNPCPVIGPGLVGNQDELLPTLGAVQQYMKPELGPSSGTRIQSVDQANPSSQFGSAGMAGLDGEWVVFVQAAGDDDTLAAHAAALRDLVPQPGRTVVCRVAVSEARARDLVDSISKRFASPSVAAQLYGVSQTSDGRVLVRLAPAAELLASSLKAEFGNEIAITVGHLVWPSKTWPDGRVNNFCQAVPQNSNRSVRVRTPKRVSMKQGTSEKLEVTANNVGASSVEMPRLVAVITQVDSRLPVATDARAIGYAAISVPIEPGQTLTLDVEMFTDSCDPSLGYSLPPGNYQMYLLDAIGRPDSQAVAGPIRLTITT
jgi:hypothetical protein